MKKRKLEIDYSYDFELLGFTSASKGYKLAWEINALLNTQLRKINDLAIDFGNGTICYFACHAHETAYNLLRVFRNKPTELDKSRFFLVPEHPHFDFIVMIQGEELDSKRLQKELKKQMKKASQF
jgi:hypothetical protein